jgi:hypothetical protein
MALILRYRVEPHPGINNEVYQALASQVGKVDITIGLAIGPEEDPESVIVQVRGKFISVAGEHADDVMVKVEDKERSESVSFKDDRTPEERASGPSSNAANIAAAESDWPS